MERGQDWCLECGTAAPGRIGDRPGWRAAFGVVGLTSTLLACSVVAAYAALTSDAQRSASAPSAGSAAPILAQTPGGTAPAPAAVQPGATGPGVTAPPAPRPGGNPVIPTTRPPQAPTNTPVGPPGPGPDDADDESDDPAPGGGGNTGSSSDGGAATAASATLIGFPRNAAKTYDPNTRAGAEFGPAANAIDDDPQTVWDVVVPADGQPVGAGLVIDLGRPYSLRSLRLTTPTEGFTLEVYGATSAKEMPADVIDKRWIHLTNTKSVESGKLILLKDKGDGAKVQLLLLHVTSVADAADPRVAIGDVALRGTP
ncbi:MAG: hypothetical protein Q8O56_15395 [Solirubrobacteraceae bacterium]|nr:hypothetical protein [Solirubrobacteraceae bacterium]